MSIPAPAVTEPNDALSRLFIDYGEKQSVSGLTPFLLADPQSLWLVESGRVELFTVAVIDGEPSGHRKHYLSIDSGELMMGMDLEAHGGGSGFLVVGKMGTTLRRLHLPVLRAALGEAEVASDLAERIDHWIARLSRSLVREISPQPKADANMADGERISLQGNRRVRSVQGVLWLQARGGDLNFIGMEPLRLHRSSFRFPAAAECWLETAPKGGKEMELHGERTLAAVNRPGFWDGLERFHEALCVCEFINKRLATVDEFNKLSTKAEHSQRASEQAYGEIYSVLRQPGAKVRKLKAEAGEHPFAAASRLVCEVMGFSVVVPEGLHKIDKVEDRLQLLSRASRFRFRPVALRDDWWNRDQGPIMAQTEEHGEPVALLPLSPTSYEYVIPGSGQRGRVTEAFANTLAPFGAVYYRPLPDGPVTAMGLIRFGMYGLRKDFMTLLGVGLLLGVVGALTPLFTGQIFDNVIPSADRGLLFQMGVGLLVAALVSVVFTMAQQVAALRIQGKMDYVIQSAVWDRLLNLPSTFFQQFSAGDLADRAAGINAIRGLLAGAGVSAILGGISSVFYVVLMFVYSFPLAMVAMLLTAIFVGFTFSANILQIRYQRQRLTINGKLAGLVLSLLSGVAKLRTSGSEAHAFKTWAGDFAENRRLAFKIGRIQNNVAVFNAAFPLFSSMAIFGTMVAASGGVAGTGMSTGEFIAFNAAYGAFLVAMLALSEASLNLLRAIPIYERLKPILTTEAEIDESRQHPGEISGRIEVSHVHFRYTEDGPWILRDVSLNIEPGEFVAFVGGSGSGKSTLMRLIVGFETPDKGTIYYDGKDLASLDLREVRQQLGVVLQDSQLLPVDIFRNIVGTSSRTIEEAWEAARKVGLDKDIKQMPMGMHTYVMEGGGGFSGGQQQRLLLARAVVNSPRIIILDEATSALDNRTQAQVTESMDRMQATRIVIAHRLSTIVNADRICYLEQGQIAEMGSYKELMALDGKFAALAKRQLA